MTMDRNPTFHKLLAFGIDRGVSDIHFEVGYPPHYRLHGELLGAIKVPPLIAADTESIAKMILEDRGRTVDFTRAVSTRSTCRTRWRSAGASAPRSSASAARSASSCASSRSRS
jgi:Tfp pilus assembly pilus retraction ATPase PilT